MGGDDDMVMERIRKNERFRRMEEERRQERLRKACGTSTNIVAPTTTTTTTTVAPTATKDDDNDFKEPTKIQLAPNNNNNNNHHASILHIGNTSSDNKTEFVSSKLNNKNNNKGVSFLENIHNHHNSVLHPMPKGLGGKYVQRVPAASPSSSVTMSQPTPPDKTALMMMMNQDLQNQQQQTSLQRPTLVNNNSITYKIKPPRKKISTLLDSSSEEDMDDAKFELMLDTAAQVGSGKEKEQCRNSSCSTGSKKNSSSHPQPSVAKSSSVKRKLSAFDSDSDDDDVEEILARAQRSEELKRSQSTSSKTTTTSPGSSHRIHARNKSRPPRNPITLMKEEDDCFQMIHNNNTTSRNLFQTKDKKNDDLLWSDDSEMEDNGRRHKPSSIVAAKKRKSKDPTSPDAPNVDHHRTGQRQSLDSRSSADVVHEVHHPNDSHDDNNDDDSLTRSHPYFDHPKFGPYDPPVPFVLRSSATDDSESNQTILEHGHYQVPASINRYLPDYQRAGIEFMYRCGIVTKGGAILGDDMGLGKTVQTISLLAALFRKTGTDLDVKELKQRQKIVEARIDQNQREQEKALMEGRIYRNDGTSNNILKDLALPEWSPVLIIAPNAVVTNWVEDFKTWAHFSVAVYQGTERASALEQVENGIAEILVCGDSTIQGVESFHALDSANVKWKLIVVDEFHKFKNETKHLATNLRRMRDRHGCVVLGLTGTLMQNNHKELWNLVDIVAKSFLGPWSQFEDEYAKSIQLSRTKDASVEAVELGHKKAVELSTRLQRVYFRRTKEDTLADVLPTKDERIIFCELSNLQKELYKYIIEQPDFIVLRHKNAPCDCGVNMKFFLEYQHLRSTEDRIEYQRQNRNKITTRGQCCYKYPKVADGRGVDPEAVLWRQQHVDDELCSKCPSCILFGAMSILYKLCSHAALLQVKTPPERLEAGSSQHTEALRQLERARCFIPPHLLSEVPGGYFFENSILDNHFALSGKMAVLDKLLQAINVQQGRVLLFAHSTKTLDLIENYILSVGKYSYLRMDGQTANAKRKEIADKFRASSETFVFLLSTKAMGLGLNLTQANFVIMFDVDWNPSSDSQAQDRAYRIGQERNVKVFRLVARGTIEEQKYLRQVYKTQLKSETIVDLKNLERRKSSRLFRGVAGDENRKGELFGSENLLKFKDGTFMNYASRMMESRRYGVGVYDTSDLLETVKDLSEEELNDIGQDGNMFGDIAKCTQANDSDCDEEVNLGGMSQAVMEVCEQVDGIGRPSTPPVPIPKENDFEMNVARSNETQSPMYDALAEPKEMELQHSKTFHDRKNSATTLKNNDLPTTGNMVVSNDAVKKSLVRNTKVAGKTSDQIRRGEVGPTTFKVSDLFIPKTRDK